MVNQFWKLWDTRKTLKIKEDSNLLPLINNSNQCICLMVTSLILVWYIPLILFKKTTCILNPWTISGGNSLLSQWEVLRPWTEVLLIRSEFLHSMISIIKYQTSTITLTNQDLFSSNKDFLTFVSSLLCRALSLLISKMPSLPFSLKTNQSFLMISISLIMNSMITLTNLNQVILTNQIFSQCLATSPTLLNHNNLILYPTKRSPNKKWPRRLNN